LPNAMYEMLKTKTVDELKDIKITVLGGGMEDTVDGEIWYENFQRMKEENESNTRRTK